MKDRRRRNAPALTWTTFFWCTLFVVFSSALFTSFNTLRYFSFQDQSFHPTTVVTRRIAAMAAKLGDSPVTPPITVRETVVLPNQALIFLNYPPSFRFHTKDDLDCVYMSPNSSSTQPGHPQPPLQIDQTHVNEQMVRCPLHPHRFKVSLAFKSKSKAPPLSTNLTNYKWHPLAYEALFDRDNTTVVFVKAFNLRPAREADPSRFQCLYGWDFRSPKYLLTSDVVSVAQEIVRCRTPSSILNGHPRVKASVKVSVRMKGRKIIPSIAMPGLRPRLYTPTRKAHKMCVCTMLRNQARFMKEWVMYHTRIGVQRWFIYDNNSDDDINSVIESLQEEGYNITRRVWPWIKTQEAGFAHCALGAREVCEWVGFIDVDEFFNLKIEGSLGEVIRRESRDDGNNVGEIRTGCYSFGPSGLKKIPREGVMVGYTCRVAARERHKSIVKPEAMKENLINVVHHFHLKEGYVAVDVDRRVMVINHYKYQVWKVFKDKFQRRVAAYVADWKKQQNVGSKDRVPGLGTAAVEPADWANRFCEVRDMRLRNRVVKIFMDPKTHVLPWQSPEDAKYGIAKRRRRRRRHRVVAVKYNNDSDVQISVPPRVTWNP